jgi:hypothetical protein
MIHTYLKFFVLSSVYCYGLCFKKSLKIPKGGHQNPYIEEEQTIQWPKEISTKGQNFWTYLNNII